MPDDAFREAWAKFKSIVESRIELLALTDMLPDICVKTKAPRPPRVDTHFADEVAPWEMTLALRDRKVPSHVKRFDEALFLIP